MARIKNWTKMSAEKLWLEWRNRFTNDDVALATAVWCANRLIKDSRAKATRRKFYSIKDAWLERQDSVGQRVRLERKECWGCYGDGCDRCDQTGWYRERWLYVHEFFVEGQRYHFHSYIPPKALLCGPGEDKETFGGNFTETELDELYLPMSGLLKMLGYVAAAMWKLAWDGEGYVGETAVSDSKPEPKRVPDIRYWWVGLPS